MSGSAVTTRTAYTSTCARTFLLRSRATSRSEMVNFCRGRPAAAGVVCATSHHLDLRLGHHLPEAEDAPVDDGRDGAQHHQHDGQRRSVAELVVGEVAAEREVVRVQR